MAKAAGPIPQLSEQRSYRSDRTAATLVPAVSFGLLHQAEALTNTSFRKEGMEDRDEPQMQPEASKKTRQFSLFGYDLINSPLFNKGTAFSDHERDVFDLHGLLPPHVGNLDEQIQRRYLRDERSQCASGGADARGRWLRKRGHWQHHPAVAVYSGQVSG